MAVNKKDKPLPLHEEFDDFEPTVVRHTTATPAPSPSHSKPVHEREDHKHIRRINPLGMRVVVRMIKESSQTESGLYLPEGSKQEMAESLLAEVVEVASAMDDHTDEETNVSGVPLGASVLLKKDAGVRVPWDETLRIVETKDILAVVHLVSIS